MSFWNRLLLSVVILVLNAADAATTVTAIRSEYAYEANFLMELALVHSVWLFFVVKLSVVALCLTCMMLVYRSKYTVNLCWRRVRVLKLAAEVALVGYALFYSCVVAYTSIMTMLCGGF